MRGFLLLFGLVVMMNFSKGQGTLGFTIQSTSSGISCNTPSVTYYALTNYALDKAVCYWITPTGTINGYQATFTTPGTYTFVGKVGATNTYTSWIFVQNFITVPSLSLTPNFLGINCNLSAANTITATTNGNSLRVFSPTGTSRTILGGWGTYKTTLPGVYTVVATDNNGCSTNKTFTVSSLSALPTYSLSSPQNFSLGCGSATSIAMNIINAVPGTIGGALAYTLTNSNTYSTGPATSYTISGLNLPFTGTVIVKDLVSGCEAHTPITLEKNTHVPYTSMLSEGDVNCTRNKVILQAVSGSSITQREWWKQGSSSGHLSDSITVFSVSPSTNTFVGTYSLITTNTVNQCKMTETITVYQNMFSPKASISASLSTLTCLKDSVMLINNSSHGFPPFFPYTLPVIGVAWYGPAPQTSVALSSIYFAFTGGVYTLTALDLENGCTSNTTISISDQRVLPQVSPAVFDLCHKPTVTIAPQISGGGAGLTYNWQVPPNATVSSVFGYFITTNTAGVYTVFVTQLSTSCTAVSHVTVGICVGIGEHIEAEHQLQVSPNPGAGLFEIVAGSHGNLIITNSLGQRVREQRLELPSVIVDLRDLPNGVYFLYTNGYEQQGIKLVKYD